MARKKTYFPKLGLLVLALLAVMVLLVVLIIKESKSSAEAAKGGNAGGGGKGGKITKYTGTCAVNPSTASQGATVTISGSGFRPSVGLGIVVSGTGGTQMGFALADSNGNFANAWSATWLGTESVSIQDGSVGSASCSFTTL